MNVKMSRDTFLLKIDIAKNRKNCMEAIKQIKSDVNCILLF